MQKQEQLAVSDSRDQQRMNGPYTDSLGYAFGVDIGRSHIGVHLADQKAKVIDFRTLVHCKTSEMGGEECLHVVAQYIVELAIEYRLDWGLVRGIGISLPGIPHEGELISPALMITWYNIHIPTFLEDCLRQKDRAIPEGLPMYLDNDANMGALGEAHYRDKRNLIFIKVGTGVGAGLVLNGALYRGSNGAAGEFGHILLDPTSEDAPIFASSNAAGEFGHIHLESHSSRTCSSCGKSGCLEALVGQNALIEDARDRFWSHSLKTHHADKGENFLDKPFDDIEIDDLIQAANNGDKDCSDALKAAGKRIGKAIGSCLINILNPSLIVLDGAVIRGNGKFPKGNKPLIEVLLASAYTSSMVVEWRQGLRIELAKLGTKAIPHGAIVTVLDAAEELAQYPEVQPGQVGLLE